MKELILTLWESSKERVKNPFIGTFIFSWIITNWKAIFFMIFSNYKIEVRINHIEKYYSQYENILWYPLGFSALYIVILPYIMWMFDKLSNKAITGRKENSFLHMNNDLKLRINNALLEVELENVKSDYREKADLNSKIKDLKNQLSISNQTNSEYHKEISNLKVDNSNLKYALSKYDSEISEEETEHFNEEYKKFRSTDIFSSFQDLGTEISLRQTLPNHLTALIIERFKANGIIYQDKDTGKYDFTKKGRFFWNKYVLSIDKERNEKITYDTSLDNDVIKDIIKDKKASNKYFNI